MMSESDLVLVTGAAGFLGTHIVQQLQREGYRVRGTVRNSKNETKMAPLRKLCPDAAHPLEIVEADLLQDEGWDKAVAGCNYVIHTASPFPAEEPKDSNDLIKPAVEGTIRVFTAIKKAKCVKRCVLTSSCVSVFGGVVGDDGREYTEADWTDTDIASCDAYPKSKTLAEKAAWDFVNGITDESEKFELAVINPALASGPVLCGARSTSMEIPIKLLNRELPMVPKMNVPTVDIRDAARAHVVALKAPDAAGHRHNIWAEGIWFKDVAQCLYDEFKPQGYNIPTMVAPNFVMWMMSYVDKAVALMYPTLGKASTMDTTRMRDVLKINPIPARKSYVDMAYSMIENGMIKKTPEYKPR